MPFFPPLEELIKEDIVKQYDVAIISQRPPTYHAMVGLGVGFRTLNVDAEVREYLVAELGNDVDADIPLAGNVTFPYVTVLVHAPLANNIPLFSHRLFIEMQGEWMSSAVIDAQSGSEKVPVHYADVEIGEATTNWNFYFGEYYSFGTRLVYVPKQYYLGSFVIRPRAAATVGFSYLHNTVDLHMDISEAKLVEAVGADVLEEMGYYVETKTFLELEGMGTYVAPGLGVMMSRKRISASLQFGYRLEKIPISVKEKTVFGDGEEVTRNEHTVTMTTSGFEGMAFISYAF